MIKMTIKIQTKHLRKSVRGNKINLLMLICQQLISEQMKINLSYATKKKIFFFL